MTKDVARMNHVVHSGDEICSQVGSENALVYALRSESSLNVRPESLQV